MSYAELSRRARAWLEQDPDPATRAELEAVLARGEAAEADLRDRFAGPLEFGTAGLRGVIGAGETRMNRAVVLRTTWGLARYLEEHEPGFRERGVAVGYDGRRLSRELAEDTTGVLAAAGIPVHLSVRTCPTPLLAFAVTDLGAVAGVMVTASHNPPEYNGYKAYARNGAQIVPPTDERIAAAIARAPSARDVPCLGLAAAREKGLVRDLGDVTDRRYLDALRGGPGGPGLGVAVRRDGDRAIKIVYTPLHGVGDHLCRRALAEAGFTAVESVREQQEPDAAFPTVAFPNPEEKGAMDLAFALARARDAALVLANDPDADRLAAAVRVEPGRYVQLTGNELGVLLGHYLLTEGPGGDRVVMTSIVSSPLLGVIARELGVRYEETLTGFKWIANLAIDLERSTGTRFVFGYEEALGYTVGPFVRDKDGIGAAVLLAELAAVRRAQGKTLLDELAAVSRRFGLYASGQLSKTYKGAQGPQTMSALMARLRAAPPERVGPHAVLATRDYQARERRARDGEATPLALPRSNVLAFELEGGHRVIARPSGTEPKLKLYFDVRGEIASDEPYLAAKARAEAQVRALADTFGALVAS